MKKLDIVLKNRVTDFLASALLRKFSGQGCRFGCGPEVHSALKDLHVARLLLYNVCPECMSDTSRVTALTSPLVCSVKSLVDSQHTHTSFTHAHCHFQADSDIFGSTDEAKASKATKRPKKATTRDEDLFRDDTDIFADLPPTGKPREKKAKTKKEKSIFKDDVGEFDTWSDSKGCPEGLDP